MKQTMNSKELEQVNGGCTISPLMMLKRKKVIDAIKDKRKAEREAAEAAAPAGILGEMSDLEDLLISLR